MTGPAWIFLVLAILFFIAWGRAAKRGDAERAAQLMADHIRVPQRRLKRGSKGAEAK